jgi:hypothetical protein
MNTKIRAFLFVLACPLYNLALAQIPITEKVALQLSTFTINYDENNKRISCFPGLDYQIVSNNKIVYESGNLAENTFPSGSFFENNHPFNAAIILPVGNYQLNYKAQYKAQNFPVYAGIYSIEKGNPYSYQGLDTVIGNTDYLTGKFLTPTDPELNSNVFQLKNYFKAVPTQIKVNDLTSENDQIVKVLRFNVRKNGKISLDNYKVSVQGLRDYSQGSKESFNYFLPVYLSPKNSNELENYTLRVSEITNENNFVTFKVFPNRGGDISYFQKITQNGTLSVEEQDVFVSPNEFKITNGSIATNLKNSSPIKDNETIYKLYSMASYKMINNVQWLGKDNKLTSKNSNPSIVKCAETYKIIQAKDCNLEIVKPEIAEGCDKNGFKAFRLYAYENNVQIPEKDLKWRHELEPNNWIANNWIWLEANKTSTIILSKTDNSKSSKIYLETNECTSKLKLLLCNGLALEYSTVLPNEKLVQNQTNFSVSTIGQGIINIKSTTAFSSLKFYTLQGKVLFEKHNEGAFKNETIVNNYFAKEAMIIELHYKNGLLARKKIVFPKPN